MYSGESSVAPDDHVLEGQSSECDEYRETDKKPPVPAKRTKKVGRRHTLGGAHGPSQAEQKSAVREAMVRNFKSTSSTEIIHHAASSEMFNTISRREADSKRKAFLRYLQKVYPQHADAIAGKHKPSDLNASHGRSRTSYSSSETSSFEPLVPAIESSYPGFVRGSRIRASLPIVRSNGRGGYRPRVVYLQYEGETRAAELPPELTSLDTIRALFVQSYPGLLTMPVLDKQRHSLLLKNTKTGKFDEIDSVKRIKDRSFIRARPRDGVSGIPMPGMKKSVNNEKVNGNSENRINNRTGLPQNCNQNNNGNVGEARKLNAHGMKPNYSQKMPKRSLATSPESSTTTSPKLGANSNAQKPNGNLSSFGYNPKSRVASPKVIGSPNGTERQPHKENVPKDTNNNTNNASDLHSSGSLPSAAPAPVSPTGNGLGGGSVSKTGFSYVHGTGVPSYRQSPITVSQGSLNSNKSDGNANQSPLVKTKLQPLGAPLKGEARKGSPSEGGKRSIPVPKPKKYGSLIPPSIFRNGKSPSNNTTPTSSGNDSGSGNSETEKETVCNATLPKDKAPPPPPPNRPRLPSGFRSVGQVPPPTAPKPTASRLASMQSSSSSLPTTGSLTETPPSSVTLVSAQVHSSAPMVYDDPPPELSAFSNIKRPESPEPRATINGRGSSRSLRPKHMLKPVSIPQVPTLQSVHRQLSEEVSKSDVDIRNTNSVTENKENDPGLLKETSQSAPNLAAQHLVSDENDPAALNPKENTPALTPRQYVDLICASTEESMGSISNSTEDTHKDTSKESSDGTTSLKRGLSSLKRFIPGRSSTKHSKTQSSKTSSSEHVKPEIVGPTHTEENENNDAQISSGHEHRAQTPEVIEQAAPAPSVHSLASKFENEAVTRSSDGSDIIVPHHQNSTLKKPTIPTTSLVSHLVKNGTRETSQPNPVTSSDTVDLTQHFTNPTNVIRKSNLVKTGSYNSVNSSDSSISNATGSSVSQHKTSVQKKVSFQDNVMVSDGHGANTYVQRLKTKGEDAEPSLSTTSDTKTRASAAEQLRIVATESDYKQYLNNHAFAGNRVLSPVSQAIERKSAVEAAIETITGKQSSRKVTINDSYRAATQRPLTPSYQFASSPPEALPSPVGAPIEEGEMANYNTYETTSYTPGQTPYKEIWYPPYGQVPSPTSYPPYPNPMRTQTPNPVSVYDQYPAAILAVGPSPTVAFSPMSHNDGNIGGTREHSMSPQSNIPASSGQTAPYFQTQSGFPYDEGREPNEVWNADPTPYYERCGSWKRGNPTSGKGIPHTDPSKPPSEPNAKVNENDNVVAMRREGRGIRTVSPPADKATQERVKAMEQQIANLTGMVETMITHTDKEINPNVGEKNPKNISGKVQPTDTKNPATEIDSESMKEVRNQMLQLRTTAQDLKKQLDDIKRQQRTNMERMSDMLVNRTRELTSLIATTAGAEHAPVRARRLTLDRERSTYSDNASRTESQLTDVEAAVEELRNEVVERRCRVNTREVEALALQLSQAGRTIADLKSSFPSLCDEMRTVGSAETEVIIQEEKFMDTEPSRLDEQLKRCKQLTQTLFTLKKLATVQEARSKTPVNVLGGQAPGMMAPRPETPSLYLASLMNQRGASRGPLEGDEIKRTKNLILGEVRGQRIDSNRRMQSIQEAELRWTRRVNYIRQYDSRKMEKALELAEKALRRTNNLRAVEERRTNHLNEIFMNRASERPKPNDKLTASMSESSSVESLPPPPPPMTNMTSPSSQPVAAPTYASSTCSMSTASSSAAHPVAQESLMSPDGGYISSDILSPQQQNPSRAPVPTNYDPSYNQAPVQGGAYPTQLENRNLAAKHYQYRSNSLQRTRSSSQRMQQLHQYDEMQRQRSRTPNPFSPNAAAFVQQQPSYQQQAYEQQYTYQQTYQEHYVTPGQHYGIEGHYPVSNQPEPTYQPQTQYSRYNAPRQPQTQAAYQQSPEMPENAKSPAGKYAGRQLRRPTNFSSKLPSASSPSTQRESPPSSGSMGEIDDDANRRRGVRKQQQQAEKNQRLKEQYSKLQQMQRKQKMFQGKKSVKPQQTRSQVMSPPLINPSAKSSDV